MRRAFLYLIWHSWLNRLRTQLARLRRPRYLVGALIGAAYVWFFLLRHGLRTAGSASPFDGTGGAVPADLRLVVEAGAAFVLTALVFLTWLLPSRRAFLEMTEGEVAFLFPAPIARRNLIEFRLLRSQFGLLFTAAIMGLVFGRGLGGVPLALRLAAWWLLVTTLELHRLTAAFGRTWLMERGVGPWRRRTGLLLALTAGLLAELVWLRGQPFMSADLPQDPAAWRTWFGALLSGGPLGWALQPGRWLVQAFLAPDTPACLAGMAAWLVLAVGLYVGLRHIDVPIEEATLEFAQRRSDALAAVRAGNWHLVNSKGKARRAAFRLRPMGAPWVALWWKNLIAVKSVFGSRLWKVLLILMVVQFGFVLSRVAGEAIAAVLVGITSMLGPMLLMMGPHLLRTDLRQDLVSADVIKAYPLRGWQIVLGEVLAPWSVLMVVQWLLVVFVFSLWAAAPELRHASSVGFGGAVAVAGSIALVLPGINLISLLLLNAAALLFPAWLRTGVGAGPGIETMGQGILLMLGHVLALLVALLVPTGLGLGTFVLLSFLGVAWPVAVGIAATIASVLLFAEAVPAIHWMGGLFDRLDVADERLM